MASPPHFVLFPFMSKGHIIPILHLARLLLHRGATITIFTTPANQPFIAQSLFDTDDDDVSIIDLPFPENIPGVPPGVESTHKLPDMSLWFHVAMATKLMKPQFEKALKSLPNVACMITDGFLGWTLDSATKYGIPRIVYYGMGYFAMAVNRDVGQSGILRETGYSDDNEFPVPNFPWLKLTTNDFAPPFSDREPKGPLFEFVMECQVVSSKSYGMVVNSFYELEPIFAEYYSRNCEPKAWSVGPLCLAELAPKKIKSPAPWMQWLDDKLEHGKTVLYVAFGSQAEISPEQFRELKFGLEKSEVNFLWAVRTNESERSDGFEERVKNRGLIVREWVDQREILGHQSVQGFLSHCGWNSVLESICAKVPILAWPMMAEQPLNARMVVEEIKVGIRVETCDGSVRGFVKAEGLEKTVRELMEGEIGQEVRKKVKGFGEAAIKAVQVGGSSWKALNELLNEMQENYRILLR